jgi:MFS family permease
MRVSVREHAQILRGRSTFLFPIVAYAVTRSPTATAITGTAFTLGRVATRLPAGALIDRWNRRAVMMISGLCGLLLFGSVGIALAFDRLALPHLVVVAGLAGITSSFFDPAEQASLRTIVPVRQLPTALSQDAARSHVASLVGPPLGGALFAAGRAIPFLIDALTYLVSAIAVSLIRTPLPAPEPVDQRRNLWRDIGEGLRFMASNGFFRAVAAFQALVNFGMNALFLAVVLKLLSAGERPAVIGVLQSIAAVAGIVGAIAAPWLVRRIPTGTLAIGTGLILAVAAAGMAFTDNVVAIGCLFAVALLGNPAGNAAIMSFLFSSTPDRLQGRMNSALGFSSTVLLPLAPLTGGLPLAELGGRAAVLIAAAITSLAALALLASRHVREVGTPDRWPAPND